MKMMVFFIGVPLQVVVWCMRCAAYDGVSAAVQLVICCMSSCGAGVPYADILRCSTSCCVLQLKLQNKRSKCEVVVVVVDCGETPQ